MHNREITHIVKTDSLSKTQLRESYGGKHTQNTHTQCLCKHNAKARFKTLNIQIVQVPPPLY